MARTTSELRRAVTMQAFAELESTECRCGGQKKQRQAFCWRCFEKLSEEFKSRSYFFDRPRFPKRYLLALKDLREIEEAKFVAAMAALEA